MASQSTSPSTANDVAHPQPHSKASAALIVGALGVVFGDIGTSPLYALRETFLHDTSLAPTPEHVLGVLSTLFWAVTLTVTIKYVTLIMRADNKGEGGVLALATLGTHGLNGKGRRIRIAITLLAVIGLSLFYGDAIITPAISVMSAVEGLSAVTPAFEPFVVPSALAILVALFMLQSRGTADVGRLFGPVMLIWFVVLGVLGAWQIAKNPAVLWAINPSCWPSILLMPSTLSPTRAWASSWRSARSCWPSPAPRHSTPTWDISVASRSAPPGSASSCRACC